VLTFQLDTTQVQARIANMAAQVAAMPPKMQEQMTTWQSADMNRKRPETETPDDHTVATQVWRRGRPMVMLLKTGSKFSHPGHPYRGMMSVRPILRPVLFDQLHARMVALLAAIKW
jgi:hypothetical protein